MSNGKGDRQRCRVCNRKRRGSNHDKGDHHNKRVKPNGRK